MKLIEKFEDLEKAIAYIKEVNSAYKVLIIASEDSAKSVSELTKKLESAISEKTDLVQNINELKLINIDLSERIDAFDTNSVDELKADLDSANAIIADLGQQLQALNTIAADGKRIVSIGGKQYQLDGDSFHIPKFGPMTGEQLAANTQVLEMLLAKESGILTPVEADN